MKVPSFRHLSDSDLTTTLAAAVQRERRCTVITIACSRNSIDVDSFYRRDTRHCSPTAPSTSISGKARRTVALRLRAVKRFPVILGLLADGHINLSTIGLIARHLTERKFKGLLEEVRHKSKREVEILVARLAPKPDATTVIRRAPPAPTPLVVQERTLSPLAEAPVAPMTAPITPPRPVIAPLAPERFKLQITISHETHDTLRQLQNLMRHSIPSGDAAVIVERALHLLLQQVLRRKCGMRKRDLPALDPEQAEIGGHARLLH